MDNNLSIIFNQDKSYLKIAFSDFLNLEISEIEFAQITALYLTEQVSIMELCKCYQEQYMPL